MMMSKRILAGAALAAIVAAFIVPPAVSQGNSTPVARYTIDAGTVSGMAAMGSGGGVAGALSALGGGGSQAMHELFLRLGSSNPATGEPQGEHFMPEGAGLGESVPLVTPRAAPTEGAQEVPGMAQGQMPSGRLLLFWGCGEHAAPGQPVIIDFSNLARGQVPPNLYAQPLNVAEQWSVNAGNSRTYGEWPNERTDRQVPANASLRGQHRIASTYAPEIAFDLADDFMPALRPVTRDAEGGAVSLSWNALPTAAGYYAWAMATGAEGAAEGRDMVWWSSSSTQQFGGPMWDWLAPAAVRALVEAQTVMPPSQTECTIPAEVRSAGGPMLMTNLFAYGPQADFSHPERPANAPSSWSPEWIARVRFRANAMVMHGMPSFDEADRGGEQIEQAEPGAPAKPRCRGGLRGIAERAAGLCE
jgi:hypothetical protein